METHGKQVKYDRYKTWSRVIILSLTVRAVAVFSSPRDTSAGEVPDLVTANTGDNSRVDVSSSYLAARRRRQVRT